MTLTVLAENVAHPENRDLKADHGLSILIETDNAVLLYDFGSMETLEHNAQHLQKNLADVDQAILSHGHYDHSGSMADFLRLNEKASISHGRGAFHPRWSISKGSPRDVGIPLIPTEKVVKRLRAVDALDDRETYVVLPAAPGLHGRPAGNAAFLAGPEGNRLQDDFTDELTMVLRSDVGLVILTGCSHRGILNIIDQVKAYCPQCPIAGLIGGFHLVDKQESEDSLNAIADSFAAELQNTKIFAGHCTGEESLQAIQSRCGSTIERLHVGKVITF